MWGFGYGSLLSSLALSLKDSAGTLSKLLVRFCLYNIMLSLYLHHINVTNIDVISSHPLLIFFYATETVTLTLTYKTTSIKHIKLHRTKFTCRPIQNQNKLLIQSNSQNKLLTQYSSFTCTIQIQSCSNMVQCSYTTHRACTTNTS